jgi:hypothetical protein
MIDNFKTFFAYARPVHEGNFELGQKCIFSHSAASNKSLFAFEMMMLVRGS